MYVMLNKLPPTFDWEAFAAFIVIRRRKSVICNGVSSHPLTFCICDGTLEDLKWLKSLGYSAEEVK